jgi:hypothetical protein
VLHHLAFDDRLVDDVLAGQKIGNFAQAEPTRNVDDLLALEWASGFELVLAERIGEPARERDHEDDGEDGIAGDHQRMTCSARGPLRLRHVFRLQRRARTARGDTLRRAGSACVSHVHSRAAARTLSLIMAKG